MPIQYRKILLLSLSLCFLLTALPQPEVYGQRRVERRKLFSKKKRNKRGIFSFLFQRGRRCPDLSSNAQTEPRLSRREQRRLARRNAQIAASANKKLRSEELPPIKKEESKTASLDPPEALSVGKEPDMETLSVTLPKASVSPEEPPEPEEEPLKSVPEVAERKPMPAKKPAAVAIKPKPAPKEDPPPSVSPEKRKKGAVWFVSETAVAEEMEDFTFSSDEAAFSEADHSLMKKLAQQYRYGFSIYLIEELSPSEVAAGKVQTYRRMNRIKTMLIGSYKVAPEAIYMSSRPSTGASSRVLVELR